MEDKIYYILTDLLRDDISKGEAIEKLLVLCDVGKCNELLCDFIMQYDSEISLEDAETEVSTFMQMKA
tara:strand:- start:442 stop:645 length:204 start_codon:yes stop_codon:yes gene_type:complete